MVSSNLNNYILFFHYDDILNSFIEVFGKTFYVTESTNNTLSFVVYKTHDFFKRRRLIMVDSFHHECNNCVCHGELKNDIIEFTTRYNIITNINKHEMELMNRHGLKLKHQKQRSYNTCFQEVKHNYRSLQFLTNYEKQQNNYKILTYALRNNPNSIRFINNSPPRISMDIVRKTPLNIKYINNQTHDICITALKRNYKSLKYINNQTKSLCNVALRIDAKAFKYIRNQTRSQCAYALVKDYTNLRFVNKQTSVLCEIAFRMDMRAIRFVKHDQNKEKIYLHLVKLNGLCLRYISDQTYTLCKAAVVQNGLALEYVKQQLDVLCLCAVGENNLAIKHVKDKVFASLLSKKLKNK